MEVCKCTKEAEIAIISTKIEGITGDIRTIKEDVNSLRKIYGVINDLTVNLSVVVEQMKTNTKDIKEIKDDIGEMKKSPSEADRHNKRQADKFEHYQKLILGGIVTAIIGFLMGSFIGGI